MTNRRHQRDDPQGIKIFVADVFSMIIFSWVVGFPLDYFLAKLSLFETLRSRAIATIVNFFIARPHTFYSRFVRNRITDFEKRNVVTRYLVETFAYASFQAPISYALLRFNGASHENARNTIYTVVALTFILNFLFNRFNKYVHTKFKLSTSN